jgi:hypothetical protein
VRGSGDAGIAAAARTTAGPSPVAPRLHELVGRSQTNRGQICASHHATFFRRSRMTPNTTAAYASVTTAIATPIALA